MTWLLSFLHTCFDEARVLKTTQAAPSAGALSAEAQMTLDTVLDPCAMGCRTARRASTRPDFSSAHPAGAPSFP